MILRMQFSKNCSCVQGLRRKRFVLEIKRSWCNICHEARSYFGIAMSRDMYASKKWEKEEEKEEKKGKEGKKGRKKGEGGRF